MMRKGMKGISLLELLFVVAISGILMGIGGFTVQGFRSRYDAESQVRQLHVDMMNARVQALEKSRVYYMILTTNGYQIIEDTNESGGTAPDNGDKPLWSEPKQFKFPSLWSGTLIMDERGIVSKSTSPILANGGLMIRFDTAGTNPEYDCISTGPTRIRPGKWNGIKCVTR
jgi:type II secretory pathway pseudopilin PulG